MKATGEEIVGEEEIEEDPTKEKNNEEEKYLLKMIYEQMFQRKLKNGGQRIWMKNPRKIYQKLRHERQYMNLTTKKIVIDDKGSLKEVGVKKKKNDVGEEIVGEEAVKEQPKEEKCLVEENDIGIDALEKTE